MSRNNFKITLLTAFALFFTTSQLQAQSDNTVSADGRSSNRIYTAMSFLMIAPDARAGAMGDLGVATQPDAYSVHWNPAKLALIKTNSAVSLSYSPWLKNLAPDIDFAYLSAYKRISERTVMAGSLRYFSFGEFQLADDYQNSLGAINPNEFAIDLAFSRKFGESFSLGTAVRYVRSRLDNVQFIQSNASHSSALSTDLSAFYTQKTQVFGSDVDWNIGLNVSNIAVVKKLPLSTNGPQFLPANLRLGTAMVFHQTNDDLFTLAVDFNKLLVPLSQTTTTNMSLVSSIFKSFSDAPGGFSEELQEISYSIGAEYNFKQKFPVRAGYFHESPVKGNRQFFTLGAGFRYDKFELDLGYILANQTQSPLANTLRFSLSYQLGKTPSN